MAAAAGEGGEGGAGAAVAKEQRRPAAAVVAPVPSEESMAQAHDIPPAAASSYPTPAHAHAHALPLPPRLSHPDASHSSGRAGAVPQDPSADPDDQPAEEKRTAGPATEEETNIPSHSEGVVGGGGAHSGARRESTRADTAGHAPPHTPAAAASPAPHFAAPSSFLRPVQGLRSPPERETAVGVRGPAGRRSSATAPVGAGAAACVGGRPASSGSMGSYSQRSGGRDGPLDREQREGLKAIRAFLKVRTSYDVLPLSFRLVVFDTALLVKKSLNILIQNGIVSAPLWDSRTSTFAGLLTTSDYINVIQYYWQNPDSFKEIDQFRLQSLPDVERAIGVQPLETVSIHPDRPLYEACRKMLESKARRIPLVDFDDETQRAMVVSVVTQYRILKFVAVNVGETAKLRKPLKELRLGTYSEPGKELVTARMDTPVMEVIHNLVKRSISSVPILEKDGSVINVFEAVDVITLIKGGVYDDLNLTVGEALLKRSEDFSGIYTCTLNDRLDAIFDTIRKSRVHRLVVIDEGMQLKGVLTLSDILEYVLLEGEEGEDG